MSVGSVDEVLRASQFVCVGCVVCMSNIWQQGVLVNYVSVVCVGCVCQLCVSVVCVGSAVCI